MLQTATPRKPTDRGYHRGRIPANKGLSYPAEILTPVEIQALISQCSNRAPTGIRNRALIVTLWRAGHRLAEALALKPADVDVRAGTIAILRGKGGKRRTVGIDPTAVDIVARWLDARRRLGLTGHRPLFCTLGGQPLKPSYVRTLLPRLARKAGLEKRAHPHGLRHAHAAELMAEGIPLNVIQKQLGHASVATTSRYLDHIAPQEVIDRMSGRIWNLED